MLKTNNHDVDWVDGNLVDFQGVKDKIDTYDPDIVGISMMTPGRIKALHVAEYAKSRGKYVVLGGPHSTLMYEQLLEAYGHIVDSCCIGAGEWTILGLAEGRDECFIPNLAWKSNGRTVTTTARVDNLNDYPFPSWETVPWEEYNARHAGPRVIFGRGCRWGKCIFCSVGPQWGEHRNRSPENMLAELKWLVELGQPNICFADDTLNADLELTKELMREIISSGITISFYATMRTDRVDQELLALMKQAGCYEISYGIEVGDVEALRVYAKGVSLDQAGQVLVWTEEAGMNACALIIYHGIQWQRVDPISRRWLNSLKTISHVGSVDELWVLPGTPLYRAMKAHGHIDDSFWLGPEPYEVYDGELDHLTPQDWSQYHANA
jgi:radical SAM superfamily enzyme YgiQ (UPF0313 family)